MSLDPITALFETGKMAIARIWPDPAQQAKEQRKLAELAQKGDLATMNSQVSLLLAQIKVNEVSAKNPSLFVSGARPAAIWAGVFALVWSGIGHPMLTWLWAILQATGNIPADIEPPPLIETSALVTIVGSLLGVSGLRTRDKEKGNSKDSL